MILRIGDKYTLDLESRQLRENGRQPVKVSEKALDVLRVLAENHPHFVDLDTLIERVWGDAVTENHVAHLIGELRDQLGHDAIQTVRKRGYRLELKVAGQKRQRMACILKWKGRESLPLGEGSYVIGRDESCDLVLDERLASRAHATLRIARDAISIADNHSRNGTWVDAKRIGTEETLLRHRDEIRIGDTVLTVHFIDPRQLPTPEE